MESFATIVNGFEPLTFVAKLSILDVCEGPGYTSAHELSTGETGGLHFQKYPLCK